MTGILVFYFELFRDKEVVIADTEGQADKYRSQGSQAFPLRDTSNGRSGCAVDALSGNS